MKFRPRDSAPDARGPVRGDGTDVGRECSQATASICLARLSELPIQLSVVGRQAREQPPSCLSLSLPLFLSLSLSLKKEGRSTEFTGCFKGAT